MAKKKKAEVSLNLVSFPFDNTKITLDNIKEFFESNSLFFVVIDGVIVNQFSPRSIFVAGTRHSFYHIFDNKVICRSVKIHTSELQEDYDNGIFDMKVLIKDYIKRSILYGTKSKAN